ncbi:pentapeptide repeat-containing protein [Parahaliea mediterranea]|uniref:Pentapeptide repeat-containing protein n=1 Tax=Parahaliea mediterranea TaxID=651086 RepID=A0A939IK92_9GAMM|nr:pentapeptide repeat-containing protein [Parahaliea mediterranea]MBN7797086.1 pentapeptide repeat-containing protein [Parahaliea mediterranea]
MELPDKSEFWSQNFDSLELSGEILDGLEFDGCTFHNCNFSETTLKRCNFVDCEFSQCNLSVASIEYSRFADVVFRESKLVGINWTKVDWPRLLLGAPFAFYKCILHDSSFYGLSLAELVLEDCGAHRVDFREGNFSKANFIYTDFSESHFDKTDLSGADFAEASNYDIDIYRNTIKGARFTRFDAVRLLDSLDIKLVD